MAFIVDEQKMIDENIFAYEKRIQSPTSRLLDVTPTFVTYYHVNIDETTTDEGFVDVASVIGWRSPIRFNKIEKFPLYGIEQIVLQLQDTDQGLDSVYESEAIILPNTIKPVQNSFFTIPTLKGNYIFRVTEVQYDNIMPDNFYKIGFKLEYNDSEKWEALEKQVLDDYTCLLENIGTENNCILEKKLFTKLTEIEKLYRNLVEYYKSIFYSERHNVFLCPLPSTHLLYDPMQTDFINKFSLFNEKKNLDCLILTDQFTDTKRKYKYNKSVYKLIESRDLRLLQRFPYYTFHGKNLHESSFYRWYDNDVVVLDISINDAVCTDYIFSDDFVASIKMNGEQTSEYANLIQRFLRKEELKIADIPLNLDDELVALNDDIEVFFFTPIIMYIIKTIINEEIHVTK